MGKVLILVLNPFTNDSRVLRQTISLSHAGYQAVVFALHETGLPVTEGLNTCVVRRFILASRPWSKRNIVQLIKYLECVFRMTLAGIRLKPQVVHANDVNTLPIGYIISRLTSAKLIYDSHELWSDPAHRPSLKRWIFQAGVKMEKYLAHRADAVMTPSPSYAKQMARTLGISQPVVIRNVPIARRRDDSITDETLHEKLGLAPGTPIILHVGQIARGRGIETVIAAMKDVRKDAVLVFLGATASAYLDHLNAIGSHLNDRMFFLPPVIPSDVCRVSADATVGVTMIESICLSYHLTLPNKIFEYLQAGLPIVVSDIPEMANIVNKHAVGRVVPEGDSKSFANTINDLLDSPSILSEYRKNVSAISEEFTWENEEKAFLNLYRKLDDMSGRHGNIPEVSLNTR
jgi:glycosyltransferase involved in cell wall biosynthesis